MVVRKRQGVTIPKKYLFNAGIAIFLMGTAAFAVREMLVTEAIPACAKRYGQLSLFGWKHGDGRLLTAADLQAKLQGRDWGLLENVRFEATPELQFGAAMQVRLPRESGRKPDRAQTKWGWLYLGAQLAEQGSGYLPLLQSQTGGRISSLVRVEACQDYLVAAGMPLVIS